MKKLLVAIVAVVAVSFASCVEGTTTTNENDSCCGNCDSCCVEEVDTLVADTLVADSLAE